MFGGTHCAGTVAADSDNGVGVAGVAGGQTGIPGASLMINTVFGLTATDGFEDALVYGADNGAHISSNSWGYTVPDAFPASIQAAIDYAVEAGVVVVFAAGNDGTDDNWCVGGGVVGGGGGQTIAPAPFPTNPIPLPSKVPCCVCACCRGGRQR